MLVAYDHCVPQPLVFYFSSFVNNVIPEVSWFRRLEGNPTVDRAEKEFEQVVQRHIPDRFNSPNFSKACRRDERPQVVGNLFP